MTVGLRITSGDTLEAWLPSPELYAFACWKWPVSHSPRFATSTETRRSPEGRLGYGHPQPLTRRRVRPIRAGRASSTAGLWSLLCSTPLGWLEGVGLDEYPLLGDADDARARVVQGHRERQDDSPYSK